MAEHNVIVHDMLPIAQHWSLVTYDCVDFNEEGEMKVTLPETFTKDEKIEICKIAAQVCKAMGPMLADETDWTVRQCRTVFVDCAIKVFLQMRDSN